MACMLAGEPATTYAAAAVTPRPTHIQPRTVPRKTGTRLPIREARVTVKRLMGWFLRPMRFE
jgi:hypothetical protein